eukprot:scaffold28239_cov35-Phaeocystis_antarctica.AAC.1
MLLGDRAVINPGSVARALPLVQKGAIAEGYTTGSCIASMGSHSFYDLVGKNGSMTWVSPNLMPVVPMYDENAGWKLNSIFFTTPIVQQSTPIVFGVGNNQWEPVPLSADPKAPFTMCANWCGTDCGWEDTSHWSTMHIYFSDPHKVTCQGNQRIVCENTQESKLTQESTQGSTQESKFPTWAAVPICAAAAVLIFAAVSTRRSTKDAALY